MFWNLNNIELDNIFIFDTFTNQNITYKELKFKCNLILERINNLFKNKILIFMFCDNSPLSIINYISFLQSGNAIALIDKKTDLKLKSKLIDIYKPELIFNLDENLDIYSLISEDEKLFIRTRDIHEGLIDRNLAILLSTSGTTGSPKFVRLSYENLQENALSIAEYLQIKESDTPITSLPMSYSYGLSVINSHLLQRAKLVCTNSSLVTNDFWQAFKNYKCNSFSGVPYIYELLEKIRFERMELPYLKYITQAGGRLSVERAERFYNLSQKKGFKFFIMYGQTEATARISYVPPDTLPYKLNSIGISIPHGELLVISSESGNEIKEHNKEGEICYKGKNVMMGYAESRSDLIKGDEKYGVLHTGDVGYKDSENFFYITGRLKRFIKVFGLRFNLDECEKMLENEFNLNIACTGEDDLILIALESQELGISDKIKALFKDLYNIHPSVLKVLILDKIPLNLSGKKNYQILIQEFIKSGNV